MRTPALLHSRSTSKLFENIQKKRGDKTLLCRVSRVILNILLYEPFIFTEAFNIEYHMYIIRQNIKTFFSASQLHVYTGDPLWRKYEVTPLNKAAANVVPLLSQKPN